LYNKQIFLFLFLILIIDFKQICAICFFSVRFCFFYVLFFLKYYSLYLSMRHFISFFLHLIVHIVPFLNHTLTHFVQNRVRNLSLQVIIAISHFHSFILSFFFLFIEKKIIIHIHTHKCAFFIVCYDVLYFLFRCPFFYIFSRLTLVFKAICCLKMTIYLQVLRDYNISLNTKQTDRERENEREKVTNVVYCCFFSHLCK